jgi:hypothetical protein
LKVNAIIYINTGPSLTSYSRATIVDVTSSPDRTYMFHHVRYDDGKEEKLILAAEKYRCPLNDKLAFPAALSAQQDTVAGPSDRNNAMLASSVAFPAPPPCGTAADVSAMLDLDRQEVEEGEIIDISAPCERFKRSAAEEGNSDAQGFVADDQDQLHDDEHDDVANPDPERAAFGSPIPAWQCSPPSLSPSKELPRGSAPTGMTAVHDSAAGFPGFPVVASAPTPRQPVTSRDVPLVPTVQSQQYSPKAPVVASAPRQPVTSRDVPLVPTVQSQQYSPKAPVVASAPRQPVTSRDVPFVPTVQSHQYSSKAPVAGADRAARVARPAEQRVHTASGSQHQRPAAIAPNIGHPASRYGASVVDQMRTNALAGTLMDADGIYAAGDGGSGSKRRLAAAGEDRYAGNKRGKGATADGAGSSDVAHNTIIKIQARDWENLVADHKRVRGQRDEARKRADYLQGQLRQAEAQNRKQVEELQQQLRQTEAENRKQVEELQQQLSQNEAQSRARTEQLERELELKRAVMKDVARRLGEANSKKPPK